MQSHAGGLLEPRPCAVRSFMAHAPLRHPPRLAGSASLIAGRHADTLRHLTPLPCPTFATVPPRRRARRQGGMPHAAAAAAAEVELPDALLFDCDGVLVDTEADGHRVAFNLAFRQKGLDHEWSVEEYGRLLEIGGGKERMTAYFTEKEASEPFCSLQGDARQALVRELHAVKTGLFMEMIEAGQLPLRPGVKRLIEEASAAGVPVAVCSTSNERSVAAVVRLLGPELAGRIRIFAGDIVPKKKPDPAIYLLAAQELGIDPARTVVIEDSRIGLLAAKGAGMRCIITKSRYTGGEDFATADAVYDCIGDAGEERFSLQDLLPAA